MSSYDDLRRSNYRADGARKATQQEAREARDLSRDSYRPDALRKASEQEAAERAEESRRRQAAPARRTGSGGGRATTRRSGQAVDRQSARRRPARAADVPQRDLNDRTIIRRTRDEREQSPKGGAVVSKRSGVATSLKRRMRLARENRGRERAGAAEARAWEREQRSYGRGSGSGGSRKPLVSLFLVIAAIVAFYLIVFGPIDRAIAFKGSEADGVSHELSFHIPGSPYYVLALGSDAREGDEISRTDTMILARIDMFAGKITMLSIPRDTMVEIEGYGTQKINAAYAFGGVAGAVKAVKQLCDVPISQVAIVRFDGVESLVDYLGGVTVDVPVPVYDPEYTGLIMDAGPQEMDGHTALLFSRVRHGFDMGDYQRQKDQRILIEALMHKTLSLSPFKLPGVVSHMGGLVSTSMRMYSIMPLMLRLKIGGGAKIYQATVPSTTAMVDGVSYVIADEEGLARMMDVIERGEDPATVQGTLG